MESECKHEGETYGLLVHGNQFVVCAECDQWFDLSQPHKGWHEAEQ